MIFIQQHSIACDTAEPYLGVELSGLFLFLKHFSFSFHLPHLHKGTQRLRSQYLQTTRALLSTPKRSRVLRVNAARVTGLRAEGVTFVAGTIAAHVPDQAVCSGRRLRRQIISELLAICWWPDDICFGLYVYISQIDELHICFFSTFWFKYQRDCGKCAVYVLIFDSWNRAPGFSHSEQCDIGIRAVTNYNPTGSDHSPHRCKRLPKKERFTASYLWYLWIYIRYCGLDFAAMMVTSISTPTTAALTTITLGFSQHSVQRHIQVTR